MLIGVDHGNKQIKTVHCSPVCFRPAAGGITKPFGQSLQYRGNYYTLSNERTPVPEGQDGKMIASLYLR